MDATTRLLRRREAHGLFFFLFVTLIGFLVETVILTARSLCLPLEHVRVATVVIHIVVGIGLIVALLASTVAASAARTMWQDFAADAPGPARLGFEHVSDPVAEDLFDIGRRVPVPLLA
jgi:hypothetical protein